ncbi:hypothetical protein ACI2KS_13745 [Pseudomonas sp. NPDC087358]|uniref:hypothetical protein n=1 Tax=Pseudomonas sp. NPDC087358 TaxID=3364439 RepID=UPI00384FD819
MSIDLTEPQSFTLDAVRQMIAGANDNVHNQLRVSREGKAWLSTHAVGGVDIDGVLFRLETWAAGSGCVGPVAASDAVWVMQIYNALRDNWTHPRSDYVDIY